MTQAIINDGTVAGDGTGENLKSAFDKVNANFTELYGFAGTLPNYAPLNSPAFSGTPTVPTLATSDNSTKIANSAYVQAVLASYALSSSLANYAPLTGVGTSGTWPISITGNAATVSGITSGQVTSALGFTPISNAGGTVNGQLQLPGTSSAIGALLANAAENVQVIGAAPASAQTVDLSAGSVVYFTSAATANWTLNIAHSASAALNTALQIGQSVTLAVLVTQGATAYYSSALQIDGTAVTVNWQGGSAPTAGNASGVDCYTYTIIKTAAGTYSVFAALTKF